MAKELTFEITKEIGVISEGSKGWTKEVNIVSWSGRDAKIDLRDWDEKHEKCGKGITLTNDEAKELVKILTAYFEENDDEDVEF